MATVFFHGFDWDLTTSNGFGSAATSSMATNWASLIAGAPYVFHNRGFATSDRAMIPANNPASANALLFGPRSYAGVVSGNSYGILGTTITRCPLYNAGTVTTRATWATAQGNQLAFSRALINPALSGTEYWFSFELCPPVFPASSIGTAFTPSASWGSIFKWGDVELKFKNSVYVSGTATTSFHDLVFSVRNNGSEVATVTVANVNCNQAYSGTTAYMWVLLRVKLNSTTGAIECTIDGNTQSVSYTGQNTVVTTSAAAATAFYLGPIVADDGTTAYVGMVDGFMIDDAAFPTGLPVVRVINLLSDGTLVDTAAFGTSATTVVTAINSPTDARQMRMSSGTASALLNLTMPSTTGFSTTVAGFHGLGQLMANRYPLSARKLAIGVDLSGSEKLDVYSAATTLPFSSILTPPETTGASSVWQVFAKPAGGTFATTDLANVKLKLKAV